MTSKLRIFLAALLLVPALTWNAGAFSMENGGASLNPTRPFADSCWIYYNGRWISVPC
jgi:hypothetical protein